MKAIRAALGGLLSLLGVALPAWLLPLVIVGAVISALGGAYLKGRVDAGANCKAAQLQAEIESLRRDRNAAFDAEKHAGHLAEALATENARLAQEVADYADELAKRPPSKACRLEKADVNRLAPKPKTKPTK